jgi:hypothetical protein
VLNHDKSSPCPSINVTYLENRQETLENFEDTLKNVDETLLEPFSPDKRILNPEKEKYKAISLAE